MIKRILPPSTIGIIGGGQLGKMMALSMIEQGYKVAVLDPDAECPCSNIANHFICASYSDELALRQLVEMSEILTYEFENVEVEMLRKVSGIEKVPQGYDCLKVSQDRLLEKSTIEYLGIPTVRFAPFSTQDELDNLELNYPIIIKTRRLGYDGKGQYRVNDKQSLSILKLEFPMEYIAEEICAFDTEISVIVCGFKDGQSNFEAFENKHINGILDTSIYPAHVSNVIQLQAIQSALTIIQTFNYIGVLAVEFFVKDDQLYFNELAPRPHNSGHGTINSCDYSQFDLHVAAICGSSVIQPKRLQSSVMQNILGQDLELFIQRFEIQSTQSIHLHVYGKKEIRHNRKMGHLTIHHDSVEQVKEIAKNWRTQR
jgi:5-(carboxyamino)imidazole ribonucleotide synthase